MGFFNLFDSNNNAQDINFVRDCLACAYSNQVKKESESKRIANVLPFSDLDRDGLEFGKIERRLLMFTSDNGQKVYIQYPGKETKAATPEKERPWDFRPKIQMEDGSFVKDLSFADIWDDITEAHSKDVKATAVMAALFFDLAYMTKHEQVTETLTYEDINVETNEVVSTGSIEFKYYRPIVEKEVYDYLTKSLGMLRGVSWDAYVLFNDLLSQNEDCKYYYRDVVINKKPWKQNIGRRNTMLTHLTVINYMQGRSTFSNVMYQFQRGMGVAPCKLSDIPAITDNIITK